MYSSLKNYNSDAGGGAVSDLALDIHNSVTVSIATNEPEAALTRCRSVGFIPSSTHHTGDNNQFLVSSLQPSV